MYSQGRMRLNYERRRLFLMSVDGHFLQEGKANVVTLSRDSKTRHMPERIPEYVIHMSIPRKIILTSFKRRPNIFSLVLFKV